MEQLILHLFGDYITQSHWMAVNKRRSWWPCFVHAVAYSAAFLLIANLGQTVLIGLTHYLIDRYGLAVYVVAAKNRWLQPDPGTLIVDPKTGYPMDTPPWLAVWLLIIADNTLHLMCNYAIIRWL